MFKKIGFFALLMLCFTISVDAQKNSRDAQRKAKLKEMERQRKEAERAKKGKKTKKEKETKEITSDDLDETDNSENSDLKVKRGWPEWLVVGTSLNGGYANGWNLGLTPWAAYKISDRFWAGVGLDYIYSSFNPRGFNQKRTFSVLGPKAHATFYITPALNVASEFALNRYTVSETINNRKFKESGPSNTWLVGAGYTQRSDRFGVRLELFYDALWQTTEVVFRSSPLVYRVNFVYGF